MSSTQTPPIRSSQLDPAGSGNSVNLFRGDVNLTQALFTLPGLTEGDGLELSVSLQYQSNVARAAGTWNADAPTSVVGLGWTLPLSYIAATGTSPVPSTRQYVLVDNGTPNQLVRQPVHPLLLQLDLAHADGLVEGTVRPALRDALRASGVGLSADARIRGTGPWTIQDDHLQRELLLERGDGHLALREGGEVYQRQNYAFGTIVYYPRYEAWVVTSASGLRRVFGGRARDVNGMATARGNSIRWEVWQSNAAGRPVCRCAVDTNSAGSQVQVASAWYLAAATDRFGNALTCVYNDWARDPVTGVIPHAERRVGTQGLPYTRAMYLSRVTDVMGRVARFTYTDKQWESAADQPREYFDPHTTARPDETPSPYQDAYETLALTDIQVENADGAPLFGFAFTYALASAAAVTGSLVGDTTKRLLTAIEQRDADGVPLPAARFTYDTAPDTTGGQPGALRSVVGPSGSVTDYTYTPLAIGVERSLDVPIPSAFVGKGAAQRVFFGPDYAVVTCVSTEGAVSMQIHTWTGVWLSWQLDDTTPVLDTQSKAQVTTLEVLPGADFVTLSFLDAALARRVYVFSRDPARPGVWAPATIRTATGTTTIAANAPLTYGQSATLAGGASFFVVGQMDAAHPDQPGAYDVITWRWTDRAFTAETRTTVSYAWITAANEYYAVLTRGDRVLTLRALDGALVWRDAANATVGALPEMGSTITGVAVVPGAATLAVSYATSPTTTRRSVSLSILSWDDRYTLAQAEYDSLSCYHDATQDLTWLTIPQIVSDTLIGVAGHLFRRTGAGWSHTEALCPPSSVTGTQTYAYGPDCGVRVISGSTSVTARVVSYDPTRGPDAAWSAATEPADAHTLTRTQTNAPSISGDWLVIGPLVYTRGQATDWATVVQSPAAFNLSSYTQFQSGSLLNLSPGFLAFNINDGAYRLRALLLQNGGIVSTTSLDTERLSTVPAFGQGSPGSGMFFSFANTASSCDTASGVTLRAWAAEAIDGPITHHAVTRSDVDDGLAPTASTCFTYDTDTAGCDATGDIVKFYRATTWPGAVNADTAQNGRVESEFFNGREAGDNRYDMLDGLPSCTRTYAQDGTCVASVTSTWTVFPTVASNPWSDNAPVRLRGGWVACTGTTSVTDGVVTTTSTTYAFPGMTLPFNGQPTARERGQYSPIQTGFRQELYRRETTYAARHYPAALAIGALADVVQVTDTRERDGVSTPLTSTVTTYAAFDTVLGVRTLATEAQFGLAGASTTFDFHGYTPGDSPAGWAVQERVRARMPRGQERETADPLGVPTANLFDRSGRLAVASLTNATADGVAWLGFQAYEDTRGWTLSGVEMDESVAYAGVRSARVPAGGSVRVAVTASSDRYVVGCRYRTAPGAGAPAGGIEATCGTTTARAWEATDGAWRYVSLGVAVGEGTLAVTLRNDGGADVHLDSVLVAPLRCAATLQTFDPVTLLPLAITDTAGRAMRTAYDRAGIAAITVGVNGEVQGVKQAFLSRAGSADDNFDAGSPNLTFDLDPAGGGTLETFRDGGDWQNRWATSGSWSTVDGALRGTGTLTWKGDAGGDTFALHVEVSGGTCQVAVGDIAISWDGAAYRCSRGWTALGVPPRMARRWCLVVGEGVVLFFGDGQLLFSEVATPSAPTLTIQAESTDLRNLLVGTQVRLGLSYTDAAGRPVQHQQLHGADAYVRGVVYDVLGRKLATTRSAIVGGTLLRYRPAFALLADDWVMSGEIADAWPEDEGYPYWGVRYEASPRSRRVEIGQPGRALAIGGATTTLDYGTNVADPDAGLPAGAFQETACTIGGDTAIARSASLTRDLFGQPVGLTWRGPDGDVLGQAEGVRDVALGADGPRIGLSVRMPNALVAGPQQDAAGYARSVAVDARRYPVASTDADTGTTRFVTDAAGNVRFVVPAFDDGEGAYLVYTRYDELGRVVESGTLDGDYPAATLRVLADQPEFPENGRPSVVTAWDGDGDDPTAIGQKVSTTTTNRVDGEPDCTVVETFAYDVGGNVISVTQVVDGPVQAEATIGYAYDALGEVTRVDLPGDIGSIHYTYDDMGGVCRVEGAAEGTFAYDAERQVATQTCGDAWVRRQTYSSQGWLRSVSLARPGTDPCLSLAMDYDGDGMMRGRSLTSTVAGWPSRDERFGYDARRRLASTTDGLAYTYDPNGNVWEVDEGESASTFACAPGNNRLATVRIAGGDDDLPTYDARGNLTGTLGRAFTYDRGTGKTTTIRTQGGGIRLAYGGSGQRALKQGTSTTVYFCGAGLVPVAMLVDGAWTAMVQGPTGLLACVTGGRVLYPQSDASGSVWAVLDASGLVGATHYGPYGEIRATYGTPEAVPAGYQGHAWDAEVGLHDFGARFYDPVLRRFLAPDPQRQYASPYVFADGTPLTIVDPTGELGIGARIGIGVGLAVLAVAGAVLTAGVADGFIAGALATEEGVSAALAAASEIEMVDLAADGVAEGAAEVVAGAAEVSAPEVGAGVTAEANTATKVAQTAVNLAGNAMKWSAVQAFRYNATHGQNYSGRGFAIALGVGAAAGFAGGVIQQVANVVAAPLEAEMGFVQKALFRGAVNAGNWVLVNDTQQILTNVAMHRPWYAGLASTTESAFEQGFLRGSVATSVAAVGKQTDAMRVSDARQAGYANRMLTTETKTKMGLSCLGMGMSFGAVFFG